MKLTRFLITAGAALLGLAFLAASAFVRHPALIPARPWLYAGGATIALVLLLAAVWSLRGGWRLAGASIALLGIAGLVCVTGQEWTFARLKAQVLDAPEAELRAVGRHLMVGYVDLADLPPLVTKAAVTGVFIGKRNAEARSAHELAADIAFLQDLRARAGLPPLWTGGDQEGGLVASLSPPLPHPPALATLANNPDAMRESAARAAKALRCTGVNLNFAPVVDLKGRRDAADRYSRIAERSISSDAAVVTDTARSYCETLGKAGVQCTLKHFPGLGPTAADTHVRQAILPDLDPADLKPFRELGQALSPPPWIMLSHATVASLDRAHPASASRAVIGMLRQAWRFDGILVTDDVWMAPYRGNLEENVVETIAGGADIVLIAYDPDLTYRVLDTLLRARRSGRLPDAALAASDRRLARHAPSQATDCDATAQLSRDRY